MKIETLKKYYNTGGLARALAVYTSASIMGPLLILGGAGYLLDHYLGTKPIILIISVLAAFVISNVLLFKKTVALMKYIGEVGREKSASEGEVKKSDDKNA